MDRRPVGPGPKLAGLRDALASKDAPTRAEGILRAPNVPGVEELLIAALADPVTEVRRAAVRALGRMGGARGLRAIMDVSSQDLSPSVRAEAVAVLGRTVRSRAERSSRS
jgi:HEAT repeat protein